MSENPFRKTALQLKNYWKAEFKTRDELRLEQQRQVWARGTPALNALLDAGLREDAEKQFDKLVTLCILLSGLGNHRRNAVVKETYPALNSVVKVTDMPRFGELARSDKEEHILELVQIVMGIRLFNKDCRKGGEGIDDLPNILINAVEATKTILRSVEEKTYARCHVLTEVLQSTYRLDSRPMGAVLSPALPSGFPEQHLEHVKSALCLSWIQITCIKDVRSVLFPSERHVLTCVKQLRETLVQLHETVRYRAAIPTVQVYPLFVQLSVVWRELQYEAAVLNHCNSLLVTASSSIDEYYELQLEKTILKLVPTSAPEKPPNFAAENLHLHGFCPWTLVQTSGGLFVGTHVEGNYAFRSPEAANSWKKSPACSQRLLHSTLRSRPDLAQLVNITPRNIPICDAKTKTKTTVETSEAEVQTELHPVKSYIDQEYHWSEWELKRKALHLARLTRCVTRSQQTNESSFKRNSGVQCNSMKSILS